VEEQVDQARVCVHHLVSISRKHPSSASGPHSNIPEEILLMVQRNLKALHNFLEGNPHLFHSSTGDYSGARAAPASDQEAWKVRLFLVFCSTIDKSLSFQAEQKSVAELHALLARTIEGVSFFLLLIDHRIGELIGQWGISSVCNIHTADEFYQNGCRYSETY
jgi:nuclear pore complex protein Nup155